jgi:hypothetical protein
MAATECNMAAVVCVVEVEDPVVEPGKVVAEVKVVKAEGMLNKVHSCILGKFLSKRTGD